MDVGDTPFDARAGSSVGETLSPSVGETLSPSEFNASVRDSALDAIIAAIKAPDGFAEDLHGLAGLCRATWVEEQVWDGLVRVQCGVLRRTHLMYAAWKGDVARVKRLLTPRHARMRPAAQLELADSNGQTALAWAALGGSADTVRFLLGMGARVNTAVLVSGVKALIRAAKKGNTAIVTALLAVPGIEVNAKNSVRLCLSSPFPPALSSTYPPLPTRPYNRHDARVR